MPIEEYTYRESTKDDIPVLLSFFAKNFYPHESMISSFYSVNKDTLTEEEIQASINYMQTRQRLRLERLPCLLAVHRASQKIAALAMLQVEENPTLIAKPCQMEINELLNKVLLEHANLRIVEFFNHVTGLLDEKFKVFEEFPKAETALDLLFLCVDGEHKGRGLATTLVRKTVEWGKERGIGVAHGLFTSPFSARAAEKNGYTKFASVDIMSVKNEKGEAIYEGREPNVVHLMAREL